MSPALAPTSISASGGGSWARAGSSVAQRALVGLRAPGQHHRSQLSPIVADQGSQQVDVGWPAKQVAGCCEEQIRLALFRRQRAGKTHNGGVTGDRLGQ